MQCKSDGRNHGNKKIKIYIDCSQIATFQQCDDVSSMLMFTIIVDLNAIHYHIGMMMFKN